MPSLKDLRSRIAATKATQKITKAMQMVAASKLRRQYGRQILETVDLRAVRALKFEHAQSIAEKLTRLFAEGAFDVCTLFFSRFKSVIAQIPTAQQIIPPVFSAEAAENMGGAVYEYEPDEQDILAE